MDKESFINSYNSGVELLSNEDMEYLSSVNKLADYYYAHKLSNVSWVHKLSDNELETLWDELNKDIFKVTTDNSISVMYKDYVLANMVLDKGNNLVIKETNNPYAPLVYLICEIKLKDKEQTEDIND